MATGGTEACGSDWGRIAPNKMPSHQPTAGLAIKDGNGFAAGGILSNGSLTLESVTVWKNESPAIARNGNGMSHFDCYDTAGFTYVGVNVADDPPCGQNAGMVVLDPRLELPANNGGPTLTVGLSPGAFDTGSATASVKLARSRK
jgi:hypothetical protein